MAFTVITEHPAVRELGDLITVGELGDMESSSIPKSKATMTALTARGSDAPAAQMTMTAKTKAMRKKDDEADGEEEDDDTESERS